MLRGLNWDDVASLLRGAAWTIALCVSSGVIGTVAGLLLGLAATSPSRAARWVSRIYVTFVRGIPLLIIIFFAFFGIPLMFPGFEPSAFVTGVIALSVFAAAYMAEIFRGSIDAVAKGQSEAAEALGLGYRLKYRHVIMPQAMKIAVPPGIGFLIALVKDSSLVTVIGFIELTHAGTIVSNLTADPITTYTVVAALYFVICYGISRLGRAYERKTGAPARKALDPEKPAALQLESV
jgi:polar amino acid transport system permease protein